MLGSTRSLRRMAGQALMAGPLLLSALLACPDSSKAQSARFDQFAETSPKAGETAPDFTLLTLDNESFNLTEAAAEKPVVIEFGSFT